MSGRIDVLRGLIAHGAFVLGIVLDGFRRESSGLALYAFSIVGAIFVVPAFIYFVTNPRSFFLLPNQWRRSERNRAMGKGWQIVLFVASWLYVIGWSLSWLLFAQKLPRLVSSYGFMCGIVVTLLIAKHLFFRSEDAAT